MTELDCTVVNCTYNKEKKCCRDGISVGGKDAYESRETCCESFAQQGCGCSNECDCHSTNPKMEISCEAVNCEYNENCKCHAEHVGIKGSSAQSVQQTECAAFNCK